MSINETPCSKCACKKVCKYVEQLEKVRSNIVKNEKLFDSAGSPFSLKLTCDVFLEEREELNELWLT